jgi:hypothetical protein
LHIWVRKIKNAKREARTHNKWFSAMLAEEHILIVPFAYHLHIGLNEQGQATEYNINCINFTQQRFGLNEHRISAQQKALTVRNLICTSKLI